ncbi:hypothetical protein [Halorubrum persicum]|uniref:hypothetical protein n=1 Tax=Halorubrum persicum TaxID=1383844 RepID=UPI001C5570FF|nr:hypothetical protein [Halorubrum persicum]
MQIGSESLAGVDDGAGRLEPATMAQPPTQADGGSSTDPQPALEDAAIVIHPDGYELIEVGDTEPTDSEAVQRQIDALPDDPGGAAFNAAAHPDHPSVEMVDDAYPFDVAATLRLAHVDSGRFDVLGDDQLVRRVNRERESLTWFYEGLGDGVDEAVVQYHEIDDFEKTPIERSKALASIASAKVDVALADREELERRRERGNAVTDGGEESDPRIADTLDETCHDLQEIADRVDDGEAENHLQLAISHLEHVARWDREERGETPTDKLRDLVTDGCSNPDDPEVHSEGDQIVATANGGAVKAEWETMKRLAKDILTEADRPQDRPPEGEGDGVWRPHSPLV